ncbi:MAG TPA: cytochrome P450 [Candidatus Limnocylindria bacterium]|nr:cytochrome P450 [Candidatus Limnocylindria bacterium]
MSPLGPTESLAAFDLGDPDVVRDPYPVLEGLRSAGSPVWHTGLGLWLAARHQDADAVLRNRRLGRIFSPREPDDVWETFNWLHTDSILDSEPPKHTRLRSLVAKAFARGHVERLRPRVHELAAQLLDAADPRGFDAIAAYAEPLPVMVVGELLGVPPEEQEPLRPWSQAIVKMYEYARTADDEERARTACAEFAAYVVELADRRRAQPGDDLVTHLVQVEEAGERLTERELVATCVLLLNAGHEASVNGFGNGLVALLQRPDQWQRLVTEPAAVAATAVDEMLRYDSPLQLFERTATEDVEIGGVLVRHGQRIAALLGSANRDGEAFDGPDDFDVGRDPNPHLAFGAGIHFCLGAPLARLELQITVPLLAQRFPDLHLVGVPRLRPTFVLRGYETVDVAG